MSSLRAVVWVAVVAVGWPAVEAGAISRRKECRLSCGAAIDRCVAEGGRRRRCKRLTLRDCRRQGPETCAVSTTSTSTSNPSGTTGVPGGSTTTSGGGTTSTAGGSTTSTPGGSTTSTTLGSVHGCSLANAVDRSGLQDVRTVTFTFYEYNPKCLRIAPGQTVTFSGDFTFHPIRGGQIAGNSEAPDNTSPITPTSGGNMKDVTFPNDGVFPYYCDSHGVDFDMFGAVFVVP
jgi:plastocyanin